MSKGTAHILDPPIDADGVAGDPVCGVAGEEGHHRADVGRLADALERLHADDEGLALRLPSSATAIVRRGHSSVARRASDHRPGFGLQPFEQLAAAQAISGAYRRIGRPRVAARRHGSSWPSITVHGPLPQIAEIEYDHARAVLGVQ